jgi:hypothetical protein
MDRHRHSYSELTPITVLGVLPLQWLLSHVFPLQVTLNQQPREVGLSSCGRRGRRPFHHE